MSAPSTIADDPATRTQLSSFYSQQLSWNDCADGFECASLRVPIDYDQPSTEIKISLIRLPTQATGTDRLGSLVLNPGGPGASGVDYLRAAQGAVTSTTRKHFDIVSFDPRGVGSSQPVRCLDDAQTDELFTVDDSPETPAEERELERVNQALVDGCAAIPLAAHIGTEDVARDMDVLRAALGDAKLSYLGYSYGTYLGARYGEQFPHRVGRFVLDGAVNPDEDILESVTAQAEGFENALGAYVADCLQQQNCPLSGTEDQAMGQVADLLKSLDEQPLPTFSGRVLSQTLGLYGIIAPLYSQQSWPALSKALDQALAGNGSGLLLLADQMLGRGSDGTYQDNSATVIQVINCLDTAPVEVDTAQVEAIAARFPVFGGVLIGEADDEEGPESGCSGLPTATQGPAQIHAPGAGPILVVAATGDPATPYAGSVALAQQLESGVLLTRTGEGHTSYRSGSSCIDEQVDAYLVSGQLPEHDC